MENQKSNHLIKSHFSPGIYFLLITLLAIGGIAASVYLSISHYRNFMDIGYQSFCAISRSWNCDTISQSPYAIFLNVPVAVWGVIGYTFFFVVLIVFYPAQKKFHGLSFLCMLSGIFSSISIVFAFISYLFIGSYCMMCVVTYGINFLLLFLCWMALNRFGTGTFFSNLKTDLVFIYEKQTLILSVCIIFTSLITAAVFLYPNYWLLPAFPEEEKIEYGVTSDGSPWIGARNPVLTINEYTDYMCFQCGKMHSYLRLLVSEYPEKIRLVHRHFPLDPMANPSVKETVHPKSSLISLVAIYAQERGKFWEVNDILFREARKKKSINFGEVVKKTGLDLSMFQKNLNNKTLIDKLESDIHSGIEHGITATPSYVIDGKLYSGTIPESAIFPVLKRD